MTYAIPCTQQRHATAQLPEHTLRSPSSSIGGQAERNSKTFWHKHGLRKNRGHLEARSPRATPLPLTAHPLSAGPGRAPGPASTRTTGPRRRAHSTTAGWKRLLPTGRSQVRAARPGPAAPLTALPANPRTFAGSELKPPPPGSDARQRAAGREAHSRARRFRARGAFLLYVLCTTFPPTPLPHLTAPVRVKRPVPARQCLVPALASLGWCAGERGKAEGAVRG